MCVCIWRDLSFCDSESKIVDSQRKKAPPRPTPQKRTKEDSLRVPELFFYNARNYSVAKALQNQYQSNRQGNVMCLFQLAGDEWLYSYTIFKFGAICNLGDMSHQSPQQHLNKCKKNFLIHQSSKCSDSQKLTNFRGSKPPASARPSQLCAKLGPGASPRKTFRQCLNDRNRSKRFWVMWTQKKSVDGSGTNKLALQQAVSLTTAA